MGFGGEGSLETKLSSSPVSGDTDQWKEPQSPTHISVRLGVLQEGFTILKNKLNCLYSAREKSRPRRVAKQSVGTGVNILSTAGTNVLDEFMKIGHPVDKLELFGEFLAGNQLYELTSNRRG